VTRDFAAIAAQVAETAANSGVTVPVPGFGWTFYGFFVAAAAWMAVYFLWAWRAAAADRASRDDR
jgi:hypothetical protein